MGRLGFAALPLGYTPPPPNTSDSFSLSPAAPTLIPPALSPTTATCRVRSQRKPVARGPALGGLRTSGSWFASCKECLVLVPRDPGLVLLDPRASANSALSHPQMKQTSRRPWPHFHHPRSALRAPVVRASMAPTAWCCRAPHRYTCLCRKPLHVRLDPLPPGRQPSPPSSPHPKPIRYRPP